MILILECIQININIILLIILGVQLCFRRFFSEIRGFIVKNWLYIYDSKSIAGHYFLPSFG